jgi:hypothetical protein
MADMRAQTVNRVLLLHLSKKLPSLLYHENGDIFKNGKSKTDLK